VGGKENKRGDYGRSWDERYGMEGDCNRGKEGGEDGGMSRKGIGVEGIIGE
jgi:hypothetical protein